MKGFNYYFAVRPLLDELHWRGDETRILESIPHKKDHLELSELRDMMILLDYASKKTTKRLCDLKESTLPCLFIMKKEVYLITGKTKKGFKALNLENDNEKFLDADSWAKGVACFFYKRSECHAHLFSKTWFRFMLNRFHSMIPRLALQTFLINLLTLLTPFFIWGVYDFVIPSKSTHTLHYLIFGVIIGILVSLSLSSMRARLISYIGARLNTLIGTEVLRHVLSLPASMVEGASVGNQISRLRQFDAVREIFSGAMAQLIVELPFFVFMIIVVTIIGGAIAVVPLLLMFVFVGLGIYLYPMIRRTTLAVSRLSQEKQTFLVETTSLLPTIKDLNSESAWLRRYKNLMNRLCLAQRDAERISTFSANISQIIMKIAGGTCIVWGAVKVMNNEITMGALIALIMLVWRALSPLQAIFVQMSRLDVVMKSINEINRLMGMPTEQHNLNLPKRKFHGAISFHNVTFRYPNEAKPALQNVSLEVAPGEIIAIIGGNGSGKSTIAKLLLALYQPQGGMITLDGIELRQYDPRLLRQSIGYVPQYCQFFFGSIAQNLLLAKPDADKEELRRACKHAGLWNDIAKLPEGLATKITDRFFTEFSEGFRQKLMLARSYLRDEKILILDEPGITLDFAGDQTLKASIQELQRKRTIILITHRPSLVNLADRVLVLHNGLVRAFGPRADVLQALGRERS